MRTVYRRMLLAAGAVAALILIAAFLLVLFENRLVYYPDRVIHATPESIGLSFSEVRFFSSDHVRLDGWYIPATSARAVVLVCHGDAGNVSTRLPLIAGLHQLGLSTFIFDYRGFGRSAGRPTERGTELDAEAAWGWVDSHVSGVARRRLPLLIMGRSLGGPIAAFLASLHPPAALVLDSTFPSLRSLVNARAPFLPARFLLRYRYDTLSSLKSVACPVLVVQSRDDRVVPFSQGRRLFEEIAAPKEFLELSGPHVRGFAADPLGYERGLDRFLARYVFAAGSSS